MAPVCDNGPGAAPADNGPGEAPAGRALAALLDAFLARPSADLAPADALERLRCLLPQLERLRMVALEGVRDMERRELFALASAGSASGWLRCQPVAPEGVTVTAARRLAMTPLAAAEVDGGRLSVRAALEIGGALDKLPRQVDEASVRAVLLDGIPAMISEARGGGPISPAASVTLRQAAATDGPVRDRLESGFVAYAQGVQGVLPPSSLRGQLAVLIDALLPDLQDQRDRHTGADRSLELEHLFTGGWHLHGHLDEETGETLHQLLAAVTARQDATGLMGGDGRPDDRSATQRRHDALRDLLSLGARQRAVPGSGAEVPGRLTCSVAVVARLETLEGAPGSLPARWGSGSTIGRELARKVLCDSALTRVLLSTSGVPLDVGRAARLATKGQRAALTARYGGLCAAAGCGNRSTVVHHVLPWAQGGQTDLDDMIAICEHTHNDIHMGQRTIALKDGSRVGPRGWVDRTPRVQRAGPSSTVRRC